MKSSSKGSISKLSGSGEKKDQQNINSPNTRQNQLTTSELKSLLPNKRAHIIKYSLPLAPRSLGHQDPEEMTDEPLSSAGTCNKHKRQQQKGGKKINHRGELEGGGGRTTSAVINHSSKSDYCVLWICLCLLNMFKKNKKHCWETTTL